MEPVPQIATFHQEGHMKRYRLLAVAVCTGLLVLAGIGASTTQGKTAAPAATQASGTITLAGWASSPTETKLLRQVIRGFEKTFPTIKVDYAPISGDYPAAMLAQVRCSDSAGRVLRRLERGRRTGSSRACCEPLDPYVAQSKLQDGGVLPVAAQRLQGAGKKLYGFPKDWSPLAMQTNNRLFKNSNVQDPDELGRVECGREEAEGFPAARAICLCRAGIACSRSSTRTAARS